MFAIYLIAVTSLKTEECETMFGEARSTLLSKYSHGTQQALVNAKFLKSLNIYSLQAFALFLLALRRGYDPHTLWILTGAVFAYLKGWAFIEMEQTTKFRHSTPR